MKNSNENIIFYRSWWSSLADKSPEFRHAVLDAVFAYAFDEIIPSFPTESGQQIAFENISSFIDQNREKFAKKKEAAEARWKKQKDAQRCTTMQNDAQVCTTMQSDGRAPAGSVKDKVKDNEKEKDNVKDKDNASKKEDKSFFSQNNNNNADAGKKEKIIFDYALSLLTEGRIEAYAHAVKAFDYNDALGWQRETERKDGNVVRQPIRQQLAWLKASPQKPPQEFEAEHGAALAAILRRSGMLPENASIIDDFRGFGIRDGCVYFLYAYITKAVRAFSLAIRKNQKINNIVTQELTRAFPGSESFAVIAKNNF